MWAHPDIGWAAKWTCAQCDARHDRDDAAAVNLAAYPRRDNTARCKCGCRRSPVGASVKRRPKARPELATTPTRAQGRGTGDKPKTAPSHQAGRFTRSGNATGRACRQGHANQTPPGSARASGTPRRGAGSVITKDHPPATVARPVLGGRCPPPRRSSPRGRSVVRLPLLCPRSGTIWS